MSKKINWEKNEPKTAIIRCRGNWRLLSETEIRPKKNQPTKKFEPKDAMIRCHSNSRLLPESEVRPKKSTVTKKMSLRIAWSDVKVIRAFSPRVRYDQKKSRQKQKNRLIPKEEPKDAVIRCHSNSCVLSETEVRPKIKINRNKKSWAQRCRDQMS